MGDSEEERDSSEVPLSWEAVSIVLGFLGFVVQLLVTCSATYQHRKYLFGSEVPSLPEILSFANSGSTHSSSSSHRNVKRTNSSATTSRHSATSSGEPLNGSVSSNRRRQRSHILKMREKRRKRMNNERIQTQHSSTYVLLEFSLFICNTIALLIWTFLHSDWLTSASNRQSSSHMTRSFCIAVLTSQAVSFLFAKMSLHLILVHRLHLTFRKSSVQLSRRMLQCFVGAVFTQTIVMGALQIFFIQQRTVVAESDIGNLRVCTLPFQWSQSVNRSFSSAEIAGLICALTDSIIYVLTIYLFVDRMKRLDMQSQDQRIAIVTRKITVLGTVNIFANVALFVILIPVYPVSVVLLPLCVTLDSLSIYLIPKHNHGWYNLWCSPCDRLAIDWADFWEDTPITPRIPKQITLSGIRGRLPSKSSEDQCSDAADLNLSANAAHSSDLSLDTDSTPTATKSGRRGVSAKMAHRGRTLSLEQHTTSESTDSEWGLRVATSMVPRFSNTSSMDPVPIPEDKPQQIDEDELRIVDPAYQASIKFSVGGAEVTSSQTARPKSSDESDSDEEGSPKGAVSSGGELSTVDESREISPNRSSKGRFQL